MDVIAEGKMNSTVDLKRMKELNPVEMVVGSAITRPLSITQCFIDALNN